MDSAACAWNMEIPELAGLREPTPCSPTLELGPTFSVGPTLWVPHDPPHPAITLENKVDT